MCAKEVVERVASSKGRVSEGVSEAVREKEKEGREKEREIGGLIVWYSQGS